MLLGVGDGQVWIVQQIVFGLGSGIDPLVTNGRKYAGACQYWCHCEAEMVYVVLWGS